MFSCVYVFLGWWRSPIGYLGILEPPTSCVEGTVMRLARPATDGSQHPALLFPCRSWKTKWGSPGPHWHKKCNVGVSINGGTPKALNHPSLIVFFHIWTIHLGVPPFMETPMWIKVSIVVVLVFDLSIIGFLGSICSMVVAACDVRWPLVNGHPDDLSWGPSRPATGTTECKGRLGRLGHWTLISGPNISKQGPKKLDSGPLHIRKLKGRHSLLHLVASLWGFENDDLVQKFKFNQTGLEYAGQWQGVWKWMQLLDVTDVTKSAMVPLQPPPTDWSSMRTQFAPPWATLRHGRQCGVCPVWHFVVALLSWKLREIITNAMKWCSGMTWREFKRMGQTETSNCKPTASSSLLQPPAPCTAGRDPLGEHFDLRRALPEATNQTHCMDAWAQGLRQRIELYQPLHRSLQRFFWWSIMVYLWFVCDSIRTFWDSGFRGHSGCIMNLMVKSFMSKHHTGLAQLKYSSTGSWWQQLCLPEATGESWYLQG